MCGVFGYLGNIPTTKAQACIDSLSHRGPDGWGIFQEGPITLGHRRLSILDLSDRGKQPMTDPTGRFAITLNGEIYNFLELRTALEKKGYQFKSDTDTEVALASFIEWREKCLDKFNGMWALAIWDNKEQSLFLSRDRFGKKPLFYHQSQDAFAFASEMKALFPVLESVEPNLDLISKPERLYTYEATQECVIKNIKRFPAGSFAYLKNKQLKISRFWCTLDEIPDVPSSYEDQIEQFRELFFESCKLRMRSDVPIGTALSGGLDSTSTVSAMAVISNQGSPDRFRHNTIHGFVSSFPGTPFDESHFARLVIDKHRLAGHFIEVNPLQGLGNLEKYYYLFEELYITSPIPFMLTYGAIKSAGVSVTLDGHAGDEILAGYPQDFHWALLDSGWNLRQGLSVAKTFVNSSPLDSPQFKPLNSSFGFWAKQNLKFLKNSLTGQLKSPQSKDELHPRWNTLSWLNKQLYILTHETILPTLLRNYDRLSMSNAVEIRMPFMDHRLVAFCLGLPSSSKIRNGFSKSILRDAMSPFLPAEVAYRPTKIGWSSPILDWFKGPLKEFVLDTIESQDFTSSNLIDGKRIASMIKHLIADPKAQYYEAQDAWTLMTPYLWEKAVVRGWKKYHPAERKQFTHEE